MRALYDVLDDPTTRPWGVGGTTLSKVLHRKRPHSVVLHDRWVHACYVGDGAPIPRAPDRTWADYMVLITNAVRGDIVSQPEAFGVAESGCRASRQSSVTSGFSTSWLGTPRATTRHRDLTSPSSDGEEATGWEPDSAIK